MMIVRQKLSPGQRGTKKLVATYGEQLVCVRYRYDPQQKKRYKTIELVIDEADWQPAETDAEDSPTSLHPAHTSARPRPGLPSEPPPGR